MSQFTKSGLSKPFGCCGFWAKCDLGKNEDLCHYKEIDPETMLNCRAFQRNQKEKKDRALDEALFLFDELFN